MVPMIVKSIPGRECWVGVHKEDISIRESKVRYEVLKGASRKSELSEREGAKLVGLGKIDTGSEKGIFGIVDIKHEGAELPPGARGNDKKGVEKARGARASSLTDSSAREGREALGGEVKEGEDR